MELRNITFKELFQHEETVFEEYHSVLKHLRPKKITKGKNNYNKLTDMTFGEVISIKLNLQKPNYQAIVSIFKAVFGLTEEQVSGLNVVEFFHAFNWIKEEIVEIYNNEQKNLKGTTEPKLKEAGIERLNVFGDMNSLIMLGKIYATPPHEVEKWNYLTVFSYLMYERISKEISDEYRRLTAPKKTK